jgi:hypothetical protein
MRKLVLAAAAAVVSLAGCNGVTMSGPPGNAGGPEYGAASEAVSGDFGFGAGDWAASGLAAGDFGGGHAGGMGGGGHGGR